MKGNRVIQKFHIDIELGKCVILYIIQFSFFFSFFFLSIGIKYDIRIICMH